MKIQIEVSEKNESTAYPWWMIVEPVFGGSTNNIAHAITGPFFSREEANAQLDTRRYAFSKKAIVWCASGYQSKSYRDAIDKSECPF